MHYVYIIANRKKGSIYTGCTDDLMQRMQDHKAGRIDGQCAKLSIDKLMWLETHETLDAASARELEIRKMKRSLRIALFKESNPKWDDLTETLTGLEV